MMAILAICLQEKKMIENINFENINLKINVNYKLLK